MLKFCAHTILTLFLCLGCSGPERAPANIFYQEDRLRIAKDGYLPIGSVHQNSTDQYNWGTGFQLDACHVLTNYHVVASTDSKLPPDLEVYYEDHYHDGEFNRVPAQVVLAGKPYELAAGESTNQVDWALLKLKTCRPKSSYFQLAQLSIYEISGRTLKMMGFPSDRGRRIISLDPSCKIKGQSSRGMHHDCAGRPGSSGSPIYYTDGEDSLIVVAINVSQRADFDEIIGGYSHWIANAAVPAESYTAQVLAYLNDSELTGPLP